MEADRTELNNIAEKHPQKVGLLKVLGKRETAKAEDMMRGAVVNAQRYFDEMYK